MKSLSVKLGVIFIGLVIFGYAEVWGQDWKLYWEDPFASYYYDADKVIRPSKNTVRVWGKIVYQKGGVVELVARLGERFKNTSFSIDLSEFDCLQGQYKELQRAFFSQKATFLGEQSNLSLGSINQGTVEEKLYKIICASVERDVEPTKSKPSSSKKKR